MIELREVFKSRGQGAQRYSLEIPSLSLGAGEQFALLGPSGSGKSTVLDLLAMTLSPDRAGRFDFAEQDVATLWRAGAQDRLAALRGASLGYVLQTGGLLEFLDVRGNIRLPRQLAGLADDGSLERLAGQLDIHEHLDKRPSALSVGQRQRVSLARALAHGPKLLLADEPTAALDPLSAERVLELLLARSREQGACSVVATHDRAFAERAGLRVLGLALRRDSDGGVTATLGEAA